MSKNRSVPRTVCCAIPYDKRDLKVLVITSRKHPDKWVLPKGGYESSDGELKAAAKREALEEAGVHGDISRFVTTIKGTTATYHFFELEVKRLDDDWLEKDARNRKWVTFADAVKLVAWKEELAQALYLSSLAPPR